MSIYGRGFRGLAIATVPTITVAFALVFFYAPLDADQGFVQKIFYLHVPLAITACAALSSAACSPACTCARATANGTSAPMWRSTWR